MVILAKRARAQMMITVVVVMMAGAIIEVVLFVAVIPAMAHTTSDKRLDLQRWHVVTEHLSAEGSGQTAAATLASAAANATADIGA